MRTALALALIVLATGAAAQERKRLAMPAGLQSPGATVAADPTRPPGINRMLQQNGQAGDPTVIASSTDKRGRPQWGFDVYNSMNGSTVGQMRQGIDARLPNGELKDENRWTLPPPVGVVVNQPWGPASVGFNAGPDVQPDGNPQGVKLNARLRVPFGR